MRDIYARASKVTPWLDPERDYNTKAFQFIDMIHNRSKEFEGWVKDPSTGGWLQDSSGFANWFEKSLVRRTYSQEWKAAHKLLRLPGGNVSGLCKRWSLQGISCSFVARGHWILCICRVSLIFLLRTGSCISHRSTSLKE
jgi:hypothetical protein